MPHNVLTGPLFLSRGNPGTPQKNPGENIVNLLTHLQVSSFNCFVNLNLHVLN